MNEKTDNLLNALLKRFAGPLPMAEYARTDMAMRAAFQSGFDTASEPEATQDAARARVLTIETTEDADAMVRSLTLATVKRQAFDAGQLAALEELRGPRDGVPTVASQTEAHEAIAAQHRPAYTTETGNSTFSVQK